MPTRVSYDEGRPRCRKCADLPPMRWNAALKTWVCTVVAAHRACPEIVVAQRGYDERPLRYAD